MRGEIGEAEKKGRTKQEISKIDADTAVLETKRKAEKAKADSELKNRQTELDSGVQLAQIVAKRETEVRDAELKKRVETTRAETELERLRAEQVTKSKVERESSQEKADAAFYTEQKAADARLYRQKIEADAACKFHPQAQLSWLTLGLVYRQRQDADAAFYQQKREAEGILEMSKAYGALVNVLGGPQAFLQYRMLETGTYEKLAKANGAAISGLQPKITSWTTGQYSNPGIIWLSFSLVSLILISGKADESGEGLGSIQNIMKSLPPLLSTIHDQTGISPPSWLARMPPGGDDGAIKGRPLNSVGSSHAR